MDNLSVLWVIVFSLNDYPLSMIRLILDVSDSTAAQCSLTLTHFL